jgi:hypothetical protein
VSGHQYFRCRKKHGVLCLPIKVTFVELDDETDSDGDGGDEDEDGYLEVLDDEGERARIIALGGPNVWCAFFGRNLHSRMPLDPTHVRLKRICVLPMAFISEVQSSYRFAL